MTGKHHPLSAQNTSLCSLQSSRNIKQITFVTKYHEKIPGISRMAAWDARSFASSKSSVEEWRKQLSLSILIQHNHQGRLTLMSYQIISPQNLDKLLQDWETSEKVSPISICPVCIPSSKHWSSLLMAVNFNQFCLVN